MGSASLVQEQVQTVNNLSIFNYYHLGMTYLRFSYLLELRVKWLMTYCPARLKK